YTVRAQTPLFRNAIDAEMTRRIQSQQAKHAQQSVSASSAVIIALTVAAAIGGAMVAVHYHRLGLTLSHYDARGHLVVARRIIDSLTPGWQQIGAVWLPLPHLLNMLPVQIDAFYRTGASAVAISVMAFAVATAAIAWIVHS